MDEVVESAFDAGLRADADYQDARAAFRAVLQRVEDRKLLLDLEAAGNRMAGAAMVVGFMVGVELADESSPRAGTE